MLVVIPGSDIDPHAAKMDRVFRFHHAVFIGEKVWVDLRRPDGRELNAFAPFILRDLPASRADIADRRGVNLTLMSFSLGPSSAIREAETESGDAVYQVKAFTRVAKQTKRAATATEALRAFREMQAGSGVTSCAVFLKGVLVSTTELERAAAREQNLRA